MSTLIFYRQQAALRQTDADEAMLEQVRERNQRAADSWTRLAEQLARTDALREARHAETAQAGVATG